MRTRPSTSRDWARFYSVLVLTIAMVFTGVRMNADGHPLLTWVVAIASLCVFIELIRECAARFEFAH